MGKRNLASAENDNRKRRLKEMKAMLAEKQAMLEVRCRGLSAAAAPSLHSPSEPHPPAACSVVLYPYPCSSQPKASLARVARRLLLNGDGLIPDTWVFKHASRRSPPVDGSVGRPMRGVCAAQQGHSAMYTRSARNDQTPSVGGPVEIDPLSG